MWIAKRKHWFLGLLLLADLVLPFMLQSTHSGILTIESPKFSVLSLPTRQPVVSQVFPERLDDRPTRSFEASASCAPPEASLAITRMLALVAWPLDLLKKASLYMFNAPWLFLLATSSLLPTTESLYNGFFVSLGLSQQWNIKICPGRALNVSAVAMLQEKKVSCRKLPCMFYASLFCDALKKQPSLRYSALNLHCEHSFCEPHSVEKGATQTIQDQIDRCVHTACQKAGSAYTGHFSRISAAKDMKGICRRKTDEAILKSEACFESFCQSYAQDICASQPAWWQSLFGISPCNDDLCPGRFLQDKSEEVSPGVFKTLAQIGAEVIQNCKKA